MYVVSFFFYNEKFDWFYKVIPLSYLLESSKILVPLQLQDSQTLIVKALRSCASDVVDVRLLVTEPGPSSSTWARSRDKSKSAGGYELRRKDWTRPLGDRTKSQWDEQTIYVVCLHPPLTTMNECSPTYA
jgi:hypothetical protein